MASKEKAKHKVKKVKKEKKKLDEEAVDELSRENEKAEEPDQVKAIRHILRVSYSDTEKRSVILRNICKMFAARKLIKDEEIDKYYETLAESGTDELLYSVSVSKRPPGIVKGENLEEKLKESLEPTNYVIKFVPQKLTAINKASGLLDLLSEHEKEHKIFIVSNAISQKAYDQFVSNPFTEVFWESELMMCVIEHELQPIFIVLNAQERDEVLKTYNCTKAQLAQMKQTDPVARFLGLKPGEIVRIIRHNEISGKTPDYRVVTKSAMF